MSLKIINKIYSVVSRFSFFLLSISIESSFTKIKKLSTSLRARLKRFESSSYSFKSVHDTIYFLSIFSFFSSIAVHCFNYFNHLSHSWGTTFLRMTLSYRVGTLVKLFLFFSVLSLKELFAFFRSGVFNIFLKMYELFRMKYFYFFSFQLTILLYFIIFYFWK